MDHVFFPRRFISLILLISLNCQHSNLKLNLLHLLLHLLNQEKFELGIKKNKQEIGENPYL